MNKKVDSTTPKTDAELLFQELGFVIDADQYRDVLSMVDLFHFYIRQREYRRYKPASIEYEESKSRALWKFATSAILAEVHDKNVRWSWAHFAERRDDRKEYVKLFKLKTRAEIPVEVSFFSSDATVSSFCLTGWIRHPGSREDSWAGEEAGLQGHSILSVYCSI